MSDPSIILVTAEEKRNEYQQLLEEQQANAVVVGQTRPPEQFDPLLGFGKQAPLIENEVETLNGLLAIVGEARQHGKYVMLLDDPMRLRIGFIVGDYWHYVTLVCLKEAIYEDRIRKTPGVTPKVALMFGAEPKDILDHMRSAEGRQFLATGSLPAESPPSSGTDPLTEAWMAEADKDKPIPCRVEFPDGLEGAPVLVPDDGTPVAEIPRPPKKEG